MRKFIIGVSLVTALVLRSGSASAVDQLVVGKKLLISTPASGYPKLVYISRDTTTALPTDFSVDPRCLLGPPAELDPGAELTVRSAATGFTFTTWLPCGGWTVNGSGNTYRFKDPTGSGINFCRTVVIKDGKLIKAVCKLLAFYYDLMSTDQVNVDVVLRANARFGGEPRRWCTSFNGGAAGCDVVKNGSDGKKYVARNCTAAPVACGASPSGAFIDEARLF